MVVSSHIDTDNILHPPLNFLSYDIIIAGDLETFQSDGDRFLLYEPGDTGNRVLIISYLILTLWDFLISSTQHRKWKYFMKEMKLQSRWYQYVSYLWMEFLEKFLSYEEGI